VTGTNPRPRKCPWSNELIPL